MDYAPPQPGINTCNCCKYKVNTAHIHTYEYTHIHTYTNTGSCTSFTFPCCILHLTKAEGKGKKGSFISFLCVIVVARLSLVLLCVAVPLTVLAYFFGFVVVAGVPYLARCIFELFVEITRQQTGRGYLWCHSSVCVKISRDKIFETCHTNKSKVSSSPFFSSSFSSLVSSSH